MGQLSKEIIPDARNRVSSRIILGAFILLIYILFWRPARLYITEQIVYPQTKIVEADAQEFISAIQAGALRVEYQYSDAVKELHYRPQFGFFFLVALISLLFITTSMKPYLLLGGIHLASSVLAYLFLMLGFSGLSWGFILTDALNGYLVPGLSLALVPLVIKGMVDTEK